MGEIVKVVDAIFQGRDIPIMTGFNIGHEQPNLTIPMGIRATLDTHDRILVFDEAGTKS